MSSIVCTISLRVRVRWSNHNLNLVTCDWSRGLVCVRVSITLAGVVIACWQQLTMSTFFWISYHIPWDIATPVNSEYSTLIGTTLYQQSSSSGTSVWKAMGYCTEFSAKLLTLGKICLCLQWIIILYITEYVTFYHGASPFPYRTSLGYRFHFNGTSLSSIGYRCTKKTLSDDICSRRATIWNAWVSVDGCAFIKQIPFFIAVLSALFFKHSNFFL